MAATPDGARPKEAVVSKETVPGTRPPKGKPLVLDGLSKTVAENPLQINNLLNMARHNIAKTVNTRKGKVLVFLKSEEAKSRLLATTLGSGASLRQTKDSVTRVNTFVVIQGVNPSISDEEISKELAR